MKKTLLFLALMAPYFCVAQRAQPLKPASATAAAQAAPKATIEWMSWQEALQRQKADSVKKKIFIDVYTDWCGWCKKMDKSTFVDPYVAQAMNESFYAVKMDAEMPDTIIYNNFTFVNPQPTVVAPAKRRGTHQLAGSLLDWQMSYPSYVVLDENSNRITIFKGFKQVPDMFSILNFFGRNNYQIHNQFLYNQFNQQLKAKEQQAATPAKIAD